MATGSGGKDMSKLEGVKEVAGSNPVVYVFDQELRRPLKCAPPPPAPRERRKSGRGKEAEGRTPRGRRERCLESVLKLAEYNQRDLVQHWKNQSSGRRKKAIPRQTLPDEMAMEAFGLNLDRWLQERLLQDTLERDARWDPPASEGDPSYPFMYYRYLPPRTVENAYIEPEEGWSRGFHGTWFYALWNILESGVLLESSSKERGHDFYSPGVYLTPSLSGSIWYARPHHMFDDAMYHRVIVEVLYDTSKVMPLKGKVASRAVVVSSDAVAITGIIIQPNSPPYAGEERCETFDPSLEVIPRQFEPRRRRRKRRRSKSRELHAQAVQVVKSEECDSGADHRHDARRDRRSLSALRAAFVEQLGTHPDEFGRRPLQRRRRRSGA